MAIINCNSFIREYNEGLIRQQLMDLEDYYREMSLVLINKKKQLVEKNDKLQEESEKKSKEVQEQYSYQYLEDMYLMEMMEQTFYFSITISIYTLIEKYLEKICYNIRLYKNIPIAYKKAKIGKVAIAKKYLEKHCGIDFDAKDLEFLNEINVIRNVIVHNNGELYNETEDNMEEIFNISKKVPGCKIKQIDVNDNKKKNQEIELEFTFVEYCLKQLNIVFRNIFKQLNASAVAQTIQIPCSQGFGEVNKTGKGEKL